MGYFRVETKHCLHRKNILITFAFLKKVKQIISAFLAITFLVMTFMPCADACENNAHKIELSIQSPQDHHDEHNNACSPLCSCSCCSIQVIEVHFPVLFFLTPTVIQTFSVKKQPFFSSFFSAIWQPPKIN